MAIEVPQNKETSGGGKGNGSAIGRRRVNRRNINTKERKCVGVV